MMWSDRPHKSPGKTPVEEKAGQARLRAEERAADRDLARLVRREEPSTRKKERG